MDILLRTPHAAMEWIPYHAFDADNADMARKRQASSVIDACRAPELPHAAAAACGHSVIA
ncbi:hypothetical protein JWH11_06905 [Xanthomonas melonis]|uniref:Uncharacterized protein n=1 Tax=Xanthomonas melonis TaxID=56456 RepID=A0ABS8NTA0_9XANT|nr:MULTISPECIES: hypothetical protein [Xanthomonas]MCC4585693.1 hypothetical protein [Xanthomonas sp. NCPPB 1067]MCC4602188.1 hypothetical protein [Xanthomonas melonis]MCD0245919.1 hypothetical protein [Xanthomonas melonis]MCD0258042.1 hypothetical protein [Xanthomonas melonis]MCD0266172.1 hypothetical protein [Xanthomonas melonis]